MNKVLVTGGAGFIGSNLVDRLISQGDIVTVVDDLSMGKIDNLPNSDRLNFFHRSITDSDFMNDLLISENFDYIFLLAAVASVADSIERPYETHLVNQEANIQMLEMLRKNKIEVKKILFASSAAVYGNNPSLPKNENSNIDPLTPYAIDKFSTERYIIDFGRLFGFNVVATRFFNVYGPNQNPHSPYSGVLSKITQTLMQNKSFTIYGDGNQSRDFTFVDDVIDALLLLIHSDAANSEVFNIATGHAWSLNDVILEYQKISGKKLKTFYAPARIGDIKYSFANIDKARKIGYSPKFNLNQGLTKYWSNQLKLEE